MSLPRIVVVGGGAGGLELITFLGKKLGKKQIIRPILVDGTMTHVWKPLLHEVATGALNTGEDELNYFSHGFKSGYDFVFGWMSGLDRDKKIVKIAPVNHAGKQIVDERELRYDTLVLAVGATTNDFGTPGVKEHCVSLDSAENAERIRMLILGQVLSVIVGSSAVPKIRIGIAGGGATGVELAAEIHHTICELQRYGARLKEDALEITIMEGAPRILGASHESLSKYATEQLKKRHINVMVNCMIKSVTEKGFVLADGQTIETDLKIWTAGIKAPDWLQEIGLPLAPFNRIKVSNQLQTEDPSIFSLGDCCCMPSPENPEMCLPATAQVAHQQAEYLVKKLEAHLHNKSYEPFVYKSKGMLVSLGSGAAAGKLAAAVGPKSGYYVEGKGAKAIYSSIYRMHQAALHGWPRCCLLWVGDKLRRAAMPPIKLH